MTRKKPVNKKQIKESDTRPQAIPNNVLNDPQNPPKNNDHQNPPMNIDHQNSSNQEVIDDTSSIGGYESFNDDLNIPSLNSVIQSANHNIDQKSAFSSPMSQNDATTTIRSNSDISYSPAHFDFVAHYTTANSNFSGNTRDNTIPLGPVDPIEPTLFSRIIHTISDESLSIAEDIERDGILSVLKESVYDVGDIVGEVVHSASPSRRVRESLPFQTNPWWYLTNLLKRFVFRFLINFILLFLWLTLPIYMLDISGYLSVTVIEIGLCLILFLLWTSLTSFRQSFWFRLFILFSLLSLINYSIVMIKTSINHHPQIGQPTVDTMVKTDDAISQFRTDESVIEKLREKGGERVAHVKNQMNSDNLANFYERLSRRREHMIRDEQIALKTSPVYLRINRELDM